MLDPVFSWIETVIVDKVALSSSSRILYIIMINGFLHHQRVVDTLNNLEKPKQKSKRYQTSI